MSPTAAEPLDPRWLELIDDLAPRVLGREDRTGGALAAQIARLSELYTRERHAIALAGEALAARLRFFLPRDLPKIQGPLWELASVDALPRTPVWRVCDVGAGMGTSTLGLAELARRIGGVERIEVVALERDAGALDIFASLARGAEEAGLITPITIDDRRIDLTGIALDGLPESDLVLVGLTLNELYADREEADRLDLRERFLRKLARRTEPDGSLIVLEPATREITRELMRLRDRFAADAEPPHVFAPCVRDAACPLLLRERDWCHDQLPFALPETIADLASDVGLRRERLTYAYLTLRRDQRRLWDHTKGDRRTYRVVGGPVASKGKLEWDLCGEQALVRLRRLDRERSEKNDVLDDAARGTLVRLDRDMREGEPLRARPDVPIERLFR